MHVNASTAAPMDRVWVRRFLVGTFGISWGLWIGLLLAARAGVIGPDRPAALYALGVAGPSLVAVWLAAREGGLAGAWALLRRVLDWRAPARWYAFVLAVPVALRLLGVGLYAMLGGQVLWTPVSSASILVGFVVGLIVPLMEEYGWRGYLQPLLAHGRSANRVGALVGLAWATWHLPLFWVPGTGFARWAASSGLPAAIAGYVGSVLALALLFTLVYQRTGGNLLLAFLLHDAMNLSSDVLMAAYARAGQAGPTWCVLVVLVVAAAGASWTMRGEPAIPVEPASGTVGLSPPDR